MRFFYTLKNDIRFQVKYGFYFLYAFFSLVYMALLILTPPEYKNMVASLIILTDPAMLGVFFMGGLWLLEKGEGLHGFWSVSPLRPLEYVLSKAISLAALSTVSSVLIVSLAMGRSVRLGGLAGCVFAGAVVFNLIGLMTASFAHSVNHYMIIVILPSVVLAIPPVLTAFGVTHPVLELFPGTALWRMIASAMGMAGGAGVLSWLNMILWFGILLYMANGRIRNALGAQGGACI